MCEAIASGTVVPLVQGPPSSWELGLDLVV